MLPRAAFQPIALATLLCRVSTVPTSLAVRVPAISSASTPGTSNAISKGISSPSTVDDSWRHHREERMEFCSCSDSALLCQPPGAKEDQLYSGSSTSRLYSGQLGARSHLSRLFPIIPVGSRVFSRVSRCGGKEAKNHLVPRAAIRERIFRNHDRVEIKRASWLPRLDDSEALAFKRAQFWKRFASKEQSELLHGVNSGVSPERPESTVFQESPTTGHAFFKAGG